MKRRFLASLVVLLLPAGTASASYIQLNEGYTLVDTFRTNPGFFGTNTPDYLTFYFWDSTGLTISPDFSFTARVYDGTVLLGEYSASPSNIAELMVGYFKSSPPVDSYGYWDTFNPTVFDFTSIRDGSIDGRFELEVTSGYLWFNEHPATQVTPFHALSASSATGSSSWVTTTSRTVVECSEFPGGGATGGCFPGGGHGGTFVPDPGSTLLLLGMSLVGLRAWKKQIG